MLKGLSLLRGGGGGGPNIGMDRGHMFMTPPHGEAWNFMTPPINQSLNFVFDQSLVPISPCKYHMFAIHTFEILQLPNVWSCSPQSLQSSGVPVDYVAWLLSDFMTPLPEGPNIL